MTTVITLSEKASCNARKIIGKEYEIKIGDLSLLAQEETAREIAWELLTYFPDLLAEEAQDIIEDLKAQVNYYRVGGPKL